MADEIPLVELSVMLAGEGTHCNISPSAICPICHHGFEADNIVVRFSDFNAGPGIREHVMHKSCVQLMLDASMDTEISLVPILGQYALN